MGTRLSLRRRGPVLAAAAAVMLVAAACDYPVGTQSAQLDPGFGNGTGAAVLGGLRVRTDDTMTSAVRIPDGRVVALDADHSAVTRILADGTLDRSFGHDGLALDLAGLQSSGVVAVAPDGTILVPGRPYLTTVWGVARLLPDGTRDPAFGVDGVATLDVAGAGPTNTTLGVAAGGDHTYVLAEVADPAFGDSAWDTIVLGLRPDGSLDPAFGPDGTGFVRLTHAGNTGKLAVAPDGNLIVAYASTDWSRPTLAGIVRISPQGEVLARLDLATAGTPTALRTVDDMDVAADGSIALTMNDLIESGNGENVYVVRIKPALALDTSFGTGGAAIVPAHLPGNVLGPARLVLDGARNRLVVVRRSASYLDLVATALTADGSPDPAWGTGGTATLAPSTTPTTVAAVFATPGGILVAGDTRRTPADPRDQYVLALTPAGAPDPASGNGGWARSDIGGVAPERFTAVAPLPGGGVFVAGDTGDGVFAGRYGSDGTPDADHPPAPVLPDQVRNLHPVVDAAVAPDGSAYVLVQQGNALLVQISGGGPFGWSVIKFGPDGALDTTFGDGGVAAAGGTQDLPRAIVTRADGSVLVSDVDVTPGHLTPPAGYVPASFADRILTLSPTGSIATAKTLDTRSDKPPATPGPALAVGPGGDAYAVANGRVARLAPDGTVSDWGPLPTGVTLDPRDLAVDGTGRVVVYGAASNGGGATQNAVARFDAALALDPTFGTGGVATLQTPVFPCCDDAQLLAQADGTVTVVHEGASPPDDTSYLTRLLPSG